MALLRYPLPNPDDQDQQLPPIPLRPDFKPEPPAAPMQAVQAAPTAEVQRLTDHPLKSFALPQLPVQSPRGAELQNQRTLDEQKLAKLNGPHLGQQGSALPGLGGKILHGLSVAGNIAGNFLFPGQMSMIPGTQLHNDNEKRHLTQDLRAIGDEEEKTSNDETENKLKTAQAREAGSLADKNDYEVDHPKVEKPALTNPQQGYAAAISDALQNGRNPSSDPHVQAWKTALDDIAKQSALPKESNPQQQAFDAYVKGGMSPQAAYEKIREKVANPNANEGTWQLQEDESGKPILFNPKTGKTEAPPAGLHERGTFAKNSKPTPDEQRRADLAGNLEENLATLEEIVKRRPDLFGPLAGRLTAAKAGLGTSDPDIGTLETIKHQIGMAQISAHGMRSAQGIDGASQSIMNGFKNGPAAMLAAIQAARNSVQTFKNDAKKGATDQGTNDPLGVR